MKGRHWSLTPSQVAALAKVACGLETGGGLTLLCGPAGVGKTTVLEHLATDPVVEGRIGPVRDVAGWLSAEARELPAIVLADDGHLADPEDLGRLLLRCRSRGRDVSLVIAGRGRLFSLIARENRLEQATRIRVSLLPGGPSETAGLLRERSDQAAGQPFDDAVIQTIHEIAAGIPADIVRLADLALVVAESRPGRRLTVADVEAVHRCLAPGAA